MNRSIRRATAPLIYVVVRFYRKYGRGIGRTRLMKLLFLADYEAAKARGRRITGYRWVKWLYGPFSKKVLDDLDELLEKGVLDVEESLDGAAFYTPSENINVPLSGEERAIIDEVIEKFGGLPLEELLGRVYRIKSVGEAELGEEINILGDEN